MSTRINISAFAAAVVLMVFAGPVCAAPSPERATIAVAEADRVVTQASTFSEPEQQDAACNRARRRLWIEGEGWVVRRITTCR